MLAVEDLARLRQRSTRCVGLSRCASMIRDEISIGVRTCRRRYPAPSHIALGCETARPWSKNLPSMYEPSRRSFSRQIWASHTPYIWYFISRATSYSPAPRLSFKN